MDCDLHRIIQSKQGLTEMHFKCFARQMLEGISAMHRIGVFRKWTVYTYIILSNQNI
jgi:serine/threonine protein kinase